MLCFASSPSTCSKTFAFVNAEPAQAKLAEAQRRHADLLRLHLAQPLSVQGAAAALPVVLDLAVAAGVSGSD
eukprot:4798801-Pleurochrysis_carterae.AAC.1